LDKAIAKNNLRYCFDLVMTSRQLVIPPACCFLFFIQENFIISLH